MKKRLLSLLIVVLMLAAVGCTATTTTPTTAPAGTTAPGATTAAPTTAATTAVPKKVVLRIGWWGSQVRHDATLAVLDRYTLKTGVTFEPEFFSMVDYLTKLNTLIAAKDAFDLMQMGGNFPTYQDNIEYLNDYIKRGVIDVTDITPAFLGITTFEGNVIGLSSGTNTIGLAYDPAIFKKANVAVPTDNWTWAEYEKAAIDITKATGVMGSSQLGGEFDALTSWIQQYGGTESFFLPPKRLALNYTGDDKVAEFFNMKLRMTKAGAYPTPAQMAEIKDIQGDPLVSGKAAMTRISSNQFVAITDAAKRPLALVAPPRRTATGPLAMSIISSQMFCVYKYSDFKEESAKWISYWVNDIEANLILKGERGVPIAAKVRAALSIGMSDAQKAIYRLLDVIGKEASLEIVLNSPVQIEIEDAYKRLSEQVIFEKLTPLAAAVELRKQATEILSRVKP